MASGRRGGESLAVEVALNRRQEARLQAVRTCLSPLTPESLAELETELLARQLREALGELDELTGESVSEKILDEIFANFCIGK